MFTQQRPSAQDNTHLQLLRVKAGSKIEGLICGQPVRAYIHYFKRKSLPCINDLTEICPLCETGFSRRYYAYYPIRNAEGKTAFVELTQTVENQLHNHLESAGSCTIPQIIVTRKAGKKNNPLNIDVKWHTVEPEKMKIWLSKLTPIDEIIKTLLILWELPKQRDDELDKEYGDRLAEILMSRIL